MSWKNEGQRHSLSAKGITTKSKLKSEPFVDLLSESIRTHGGLIFADYYANPKYESISELTHYTLTDQLGYMEEDATPKELKALNEASDKIDKGDYVGAWIIYFTKLYPTHGEYAGLVIGTLVREGKSKSAGKILRAIKEQEGELWWDT